MIKILLFLLSFNLYAVDFEIGYLHGKHINTKNANDSHSLAKVIIYDNYSLLYFRNSQSRDSYGIAYQFNNKKKKGLYFSLDIGFVSGYHKFNIPKSIWIDNKYVFIVAPSLNYKWSNHIENRLIILGDSINLGVILLF